jgi:hypothetical protein
MHGIYRYIPEKLCVCRVCSFAAVLYLQFVLHAMLFPMLNVLYCHISTSRSTCVMPNIAVSRTFDFVPSSYIARVFSEWLWDSSTCPCCDKYPLFLYIPLTLCICCKIFVIKNLLSFFIDHISVSWNCNIY